MKNKNWTPVDAFVTEYGFRTGATFTYQPGSGEATFEHGLGLDLDDLKALIKSIEHHELQISIDGKILVYQPDEEGEKPDAPEETEPEIDKQRAPTPEEIEAMNLEADDIPEEIVQVIKDEGEVEEIAEAVEEEELIQERVT